ncbi:penicillin-binding protein [Flavobacterium akiainvivens]|uniref:Penicillin-binding protein n=1 Tax=Flavobacterium akiainvivens TaxID=1202724 RepID=A0A0M8MEZ3_9FLAO|nr:penicillin-binding protein [Flavobacterium akiainvivens]KOS07504.1 penicillin-binding protein [Flavobacterium akiainvivens]SFQ63744.1 cell division protein FtsI (penicillin-binding protein 3) [Flavobacterium akiainvivens]
MAVEDKKFSYRIYAVAFAIFVMAILVSVKLANIQWVEGDYYRQLAQDATVKDFALPSNRGNVYSSDGSLLATSIPNYTVRFDALAPKGEDFDKYRQGLADSLSIMLGKSSEFYYYELEKARREKNRYMLVVKDLSYTELTRIKSFPLFNLGAFKGGVIVENRIVREHPMGKIAERTIGYDPGRDVGIEGAFAHYLKGEDGRRKMQKIAKNHWKPISDNNEKEPVDGYDVVSTINVYIQDIAHHALLKQLEYYEADHGCVVVMETKTGYIRAISNLGRATDGSYYETINYAVGEAHEPGSTFKLAGLLAMLEDGKVDTTQVFDSKGGDITYYGRHVHDSHRGGYGKVSLARGFELSSNTILVQALYESYKDNPKQFLKRLNEFNLDRKLGVSIKGEASPRIPKPGDKGWSKLSLPWMGFGYGISVTPLQTLTLYNAVANNGEMVKPLFVQEIKEWDKTIKTYDKVVLNPKICSDETLNKVRKILENVVKKGTGSKLYSPNFSMAGKTGTAQVNYGKGKSRDGDMYYASSFVGYFPADNPQYSCIVIIHKPHVGKGYYGADVSGPVFSRIAQKIFTDAPTTNEVKTLSKPLKAQEDLYAGYYSKDKKKSTVPNIIGMSGMDAVALLGEMGFKVEVVGSGKVKKQSLQPGQAFQKNQTITLELL